MDAYASVSPFNFDELDQLRLLCHKMWLFCGVFSDQTDHYQLSPSYAAILQEHGHSATSF